MPFQPMNYANIAPQGNPFIRDLVDSLSNGYKAGQMPSQLERQRQQEELVNQLKKKQLEFAEPLQQAKLALMQAQMQKALRAPQQKLTNIESLITGLNRVKEQYGEDSNEYKLAQQYAQRGGKSGSSMQGAEMATKPFITKNQNVVQSIDNALPMIKELKDYASPGQLVGKYLHPDMQAKYESLTSTITDSLVNALGLPKTNESIALVGKIVGKRPLETDSAYVKRLGGLEKELGSRRSKSLNVLKTGQGFEQGSQGGQGGMTRVYYKGKPHMIPNDKVNEALQAGGTLNG